MRLPSIEDYPGCSNYDRGHVASSRRSRSRENRLPQRKLPVHQRLGTIHEEYFQDKSADEEEQIENKQWCPSGLFTKSQKRRVQRMRNREQFEEVEQEINHRLIKAMPKQEWRVKTKVKSAD